MARRLTSTRSRLVSALVAILCAAAHSQQPERDWLIVPGERVGPIGAETSDAALAALFGPDNVRPVDVQLGEGFTAPGTAVYPDDPARRIEIVWSDGTRTTPKEIRLTGASSVWRTREGISLGSTLREIERLNGYPFKLAGFAFDAAGTIVDCGRGRLTMLGCTGADADRGRQPRQLVVRLMPEVAWVAAPEYRQVIGDRIFSSGHPAMQALDPRVYQMIVLVGPRGGL